MYIIPSISRDKVLIQSVEDHAQLPEFAQLLLVSTDMCAECCVVCIVLIMCIVYMQLTYTPNVTTCFCHAERLKGLQSTSTLGTIAEDPINLDSDSDEPLEYEFEESTTLGT